MQRAYPRLNRNSSLSLANDVSFVYTGLRADGVCGDMEPRENGQEDGGREF